MSHPETDRILDKLRELEETLCLIESELVSAQSAGNQGLGQALYREKTETEEEIQRLKESLGWV